MARFNDDEITEYHGHRIDEYPHCHCDMVDKDIRYKDELDFKIYVRKIRHRFIETVCPQCRHVEK